MKIILHDFWSEYLIITLLRMSIVTSEIIPNLAYSFLPCIFCTQSQIGARTNVGIPSLNS